MSEVALGRGVDYAYVPPGGGAAIKAAGFDVAMRYLWHAGTGTRQDLDEAQRDDLLSNGVAIGPIWERGETAALLGYPRGREDASLARGQLFRLGAPLGVAVYFTVDTYVADGTSAMNQVVQYFRGVRDVMGDWRLVGVYGGTDVCRRVHAEGFAYRQWQAKGWNTGIVEGRDLWQYRNSIPLVEGDPHSGDVDYNYYFSEAGLWWPKEAGMTPEERAKLDAVYAALCAGDQGVIDAWNANGNSLLVGYTQEQQKLGEHLAAPHGGVEGSAENSVVLAHIAAAGDELRKAAGV